MIKRIVIIVLCLITVITVSWHNATQVNPKQLNIREEKIVSGKIDEDLDGLLISCFSDLYYGEFIDKSFMDDVINKISSFKPDVIIFGGDLFPASFTEGQYEELKQCLSQLKARYGKYAVLGDSDHSSKDKSTALLEECGFRILNNEKKQINIDINSSFDLVGIDSLIGGDPDVASSFSTVDPATFTLAVTHCPDLFDQTEGYSCDYMFAGHSRGGQIYLPLINIFFREAGCEKYYHGKTNRNGSTLDITNGVGRHNKDARLLADAEIVLYTLKAQ